MMTKTSTVSFLHLTSSLSLPIAKLGVDVLASQADIKRAFLKGAQKYHPDRNSSPDAKEKFAAINEAYETLGYENKRQIYDATGMSSNDQ